jgi:hypothetical protein
MKMNKRMVLVADAKKENREAATEYFRENEYVEPMFVETLEDLLAVYKNEVDGKCIAYAVINENVKGVKVTQKVVMDGYFDRWTAVFVEEEPDRLTIGLSVLNRWLDGNRWRRHHELSTVSFREKSLSNGVGWKIVHREAEELKERNHKEEWRGLPPF